MLTGLQLVKHLVKDARETFEGTVSDIQLAHLHKDPGGRALPLSAAYAHLIISEDLIVHNMLQHIPALFESTWKNKTGASIPLPPMDANWETAHAEWAKTVHVDLDQLKKYSSAVYAETDKYLASLTDSDLEKDIDLGSWGKKTVANLLMGFIAGHTYSLTGEISAIKGVHGAKGYSF